MRRKHKHLQFILLFSLLVILGCNKVNKLKDDDTNAGDTEVSSGAPDAAGGTNIDENNNSQNPCEYKCVNSCLSVGGSKMDGDCGNELLCCNIPADDQSSVADVDEDDTPGECRIPQVSKPNEYCEFALDCPDGKRITDCEMTEEGFTLCSFENESEIFNFALPEDAGKDAPCEFVMTLFDDIIPDYISEPVCNSIKEEGDEYFCSLSQECVQTAKLTSELQSEMSSFSSTRCEREYIFDENDEQMDLDESDWWCSCEGMDNNSPVYHISALDDGSAPCQTVFEACQNGNKIEPSGDDIDCNKMTMNQEDESYCSIEYACERAGLFNGVEVFDTGYLSAGCESGNGNEWFCYCWSGGEEKTFTLTGGDAWTVCEEAGPLCVQMYEPEVILQNTDNTSLGE